MDSSFRHHQPEGHGEAGLAAEALLGALCAMPDGGEGDFNRIRRPDVLPNLMIALNAN